MGEQITSRSSGPMCLWLSAEGIFGSLSSRSGWAAEGMLYSEQKNYKTDTSVDFSYGIQYKWRGKHW